MTRATIAVLGIDLGKSICSLVGLDADGAVVLRRRMRRETVIAFAAKLPACAVAMEACCGAHYLGRLLVGQGHEVRLMSPEYVRPYVKAQKNDDRDAEGIAEAATRPTMRFVELKRKEQLDLQTLHRVRDRLVSLRTMLTNQLRAILLERGLVFPKGRRKLELAIDALLLEVEPTLGVRIRQLVGDLREEWNELDQRIAALDTEFVTRARANSATRRLMTIPGIGTLTATALVAAVDDHPASTASRRCSPRRRRSGRSRRRTRKGSFWLGTTHRRCGTCSSRGSDWIPAPTSGPGAFSACRSSTTGGRPDRLGVVANLRGLDPMPTRPGSPSVPVPGFDIYVLLPDGTVAGPIQEGSLAIKLSAAARNPADAVARRRALRVVRIRGLRWVLPLRRRRLHRRRRVRLRHGPHG